MTMACTGRCRAPAPASRRRRGCGGGSPASAAAQGRDDVLGEPLALPNGVLGVRHGVRPGSGDARSGTAASSPGRPRVRHRLVVRADPQVGAHRRAVRARRPAGRCGWRPRGSRRCPRSTRSAPSRTPRRSTARRVRPAPRPAGCSGARARRGAPAWRTTQAPGLVGDLGQDPAGRLDEVEAKLARLGSRGSDWSSAVASDSSSPKPSTPENPPPTKVTVSSRAPLGAGRQRRRAWSNAVSSRSRMATASSTCFMPIACSVSARDGEACG